MRIAIAPTSDIGRRALLVLLNEPHLTEIGIIGADVPGDGRAHGVEDAAGFDVLVVEAPQPPPAGVSLVSWAPGAVDHDPLQTVLTDASLSGGIVPSLATHELAKLDEPLEQVLAWTQPGREKRRGEPIPFPDPVGSRWGVEVDEDETFDIPTRRLVAPVDGDWAGASVRITSVVPDGVSQRIVGIADEAAHLEAIALAAGAVTAAAGVYPAGPQHPAAAAEEYLSKCLEMGLAVAAYSLDPARSPEPR